MTPDEAMDIIQRIAVAYPQFALKGATGQKRIELWMDALADMPYNKVRANVAEHIASSRYVPTIADIYAEDNDTSENDFLKKYAQWKREAKYGNDHTKY